MGVVDDFGEWEEHSTVLHRARCIADGHGFPLELAVAAGTEHDPLTEVWSVTQCGGSMMDLIAAMNHPKYESLTFLWDLFGKIDGASSLIARTIRLAIPQLTLRDVIDAAGKAT